MILNGFKLRGKQLKKNYISFSEQNLANWTKTGEGEQSYANEENTVNITISKAVSGKSFLIKKINAVFSCNIADTDADTIVNYWTDTETNELTIISSSTEKLIFVGILSAKNSDNFQITSGKLYHMSLSNNILEIESVETYSSSNAYWGDPFTYTDLEASQYIYRTYLKDELKTRYGVTFVDGALNNAISIWCYPGAVMFTRPLSSSRVQIMVSQNGGSNSETSILVRDPVNIYYPDGTSATTKNDITSTYAAYPTQYYYGTIQDFFHIVNYDDFNNTMYNLYNVTKNTLNKTQFKNILNTLIFNYNYKLNTSTLGSSSQYFLMAGSDLYKSETTIYWVSPYYQWTADADTSSGIQYNNYSYDESEYGSRYWGTLRDISDGFSSENVRFDLHVAVPAQPASYLFTAKVCSPTGFSPVNNNIIKLVTELDDYEITWDIDINTEASNEYTTYECTINLMDYLQSISFDFSAVNSSGTNTFKIKDICLFKIK